MNRRTFLGAASVCGVLGLAGCLTDDTETETDANGEATYPRYSRPAYSLWPPAQSHDGGGVLYAHLRLQEYPTIQRAIDEDRLDTSHPVVGLSVYGSEQIATAVETLSAYPFGDAVQQAVITASSTDGEAATDHNRTFVEPVPEPTDAEPVTNESADSDESGPDPIENETTDTDSPENETTDTERDEPISAADQGIELDRVSLIDEVLLFEGSFDQSQILERFGEDFEQVDSHRGVSIFEGSDEIDGLAFALSGSRLLVPTAVDSRPADGETVLAHTLSGYISTVGRIVDADDGEWLFETTGRSALSVGFWELPADDHLVASDVATDRPGVDAVFESVGSCLSAIAISDEAGRQPAFEARFSGLYPAGSPSDEDIESAFGGDVEPEWFYTETPRAHVTATISDQ